MYDTVDHSHLSVFYLFEVEAVSQVQQISVGIFCGQFLKQTVGFEHGYDSLKLPVIPACRQLAEAPLSSGLSVDEAFFSAGTGC